MRLTKEPVTAVTDPASTPRTAPVPHVSATVAELAQRARSLITPHRRMILGLTGPPGAGKSTVAAGLAQALGPLTTILGMDGFHLAQSELERMGRADRKGAPDTFDAAGYAAALGRVRSQVDDEVYVPVYDRHVNDAIAGAQAIHRSTPLIITEGNYLLLPTEPWPTARACIDVVWFIELPDHERQKRLVRRHQRFGKSPDYARSWVMVSDQPNADLVNTTADRADLLVTVVD